MARTAARRREGNRASRRGQQRQSSNRWKKERFPVVRGIPHAEGAAPPDSRSAEAPVVRLARQRHGLIVADGEGGGDRADRRQLVQHHAAEASPARR
jgi:hypothetical protein